MLEMKKLFKEMKNTFIIKKKKPTSVDELWGSGRTSELQNWTKQFSLKTTERDILTESRKKNMEDSFRNTNIRLSGLKKERKKENSSPGWCGSVDWASAWEPKGHQFDSQSGHMPGLQARFPVGGDREATTHWYFSPFLPLCLEIK